MEKEYWRAGNMVYPVPAVMVSCKRENEKPNIITIAWCGTVCSSPAMVSISVRKERYSYDIIKESKEFVINLVTEPLTKATDYCGVRSGKDVDKFAEMNLTPLPSKFIQAPGIAESPVNIECKVTQIIELGSHDMFLAEVVGVTVDKSLLDETGKFQLNQAGLVAYSHGEYYSLGEQLGTFGYSVKKETIPTKKGNTSTKKETSSTKKDNTSAKKETSSTKKGNASTKKETSSKKKDSTLTKKKKTTKKKSNTLKEKESFSDKKNK